MRIGILTGGGDVPGLNTVIHDVTYRAVRENNIEVVGIRRGWGGLVYMDPAKGEIDSEHAIILNESYVRKFDREGGTFLKSSRTLPTKVKNHPDLLKYRGIELNGTRDMTSDVIANLKNLGIDQLIAIGGDDTLSYARHLHTQGIPIIGVPKTMDGDVAGTDYCIGFNTAITKAAHFVTEFRTHLGSHEKIGVIELFGRHSGFTGLCTALASKPDRVLIPEVEFDMDKISEYIAHDKKKKSSNYALLLVSEGAKSIGGEIATLNTNVDAYGHAKLGGIGEQVSNGIKERTGIGTMTDNVRYLLRSGPPTAKDRLVASAYANIAMDALIRGESGKMTAIRNGQFRLVPLEETAGSPKMVDVERLYDSQKYHPNYKGLEDTIVLI